MGLRDSGKAQNQRGERPVAEEVAHQVSFGPTAPDGLMLDQGKPFFVGPDGEVDGEGEDFEPMSLTKKKDGVIKAVSISAALVLLLAVTGWMAYKSTLAPPPKPPLPEPKPPLPEPKTPLPRPSGVHEKIALYSVELFNKRDALDVAWVAASDNVKTVFARNFMPSLENEHVPIDSVLSYYKLQVLQFHGLDPPDKYEELEVKKQYLRKQLFLHSMMDAAVRRLEGLRLMEDDTALPALILERETTNAQPPEGNVAVGLFLEELKERGIQYQPRLPLGKEQGVSRAKVNQLLDLLVMEMKFAAFDRTAHEAFEVLLEEYGLRLKGLRLEDIPKLEEMQLPRDDTQVNVTTFVKFLQSRYSERDVESFREKLLDELVANWSEENVVKATEAVRNHHTEFLKDKLRQKRRLLEEAREKQPPVPLTHGFPLAVFLT